MTDTLELKAPFSGELYHEYTFRVRARDLVGHVSDWITSTVAIVNQTKYYFLDGRRVAMRKGDKVYYLYGDHLGSTSLATDENGEVVYKAGYLPYGDGRLSDGISPTDFGFTDQRNEVGLGLMDYNARYYDPYLGRFISADPIVPEPGNPQALNRYAYVNNNPLNYVDPSGYCRYNAQGEFEYNTNCTVEEFDDLSWDDRITWMNTFMEKTEADWFYNIVGILEFFRDDPVFSKSAWASYSDAAVLQAIQDGWRLYSGVESIGTSGEEWATFFKVALAEDADITAALSQWGIAEQAGVDYGLTLAEPLASQGSPQEQIQIETFVGFGNLYRSFVSDGGLYTVDPSTSDYGLIVDASVALTTQPFLTPRTTTSQWFVREFSQTIIAPTANTLYYNYQAMSYRGSRLR